MTTPLWLIFLAGLAGSAHCVGMCGGFACALGPDPRGAVATWIRHLSYQIGRITSYCFLGAVAGQLGLWLVAGPGSAGWVDAAQRVLACVSGALVLLVGLQFLGLARPVMQGSVGVLGQAMVRALRSLVAAPGAAAPLALGVVNGFLPCPLVYAFVAQAVAAGGAASGLQVMVAFGLGTVPAMLAMGGLGVWWRRRAEARGRVQIIRMPGASSAAPVVGIEWRRHSMRLAGGLLLVMGLITLARGLWPAGGVHALMGH